MNWLGLLFAIVGTGVFGWLIWGVVQTITVP